MLIWIFDSSAESLEVEMELRATADAGLLSFPSTSVLSLGVPPAPAKPEAVAPSGARVLGALGPSPCCCQSLKAKPPVTLGFNCARGPMPHCRLCGDHCGPRCPRERCQLPETLVSSGKIITLAPASNLPAKFSAHGSAEAWPREA